LSSGDDPRDGPRYGFGLIEFACGARP